ncbi:hypothetical protein HPB50_014230 [Hyalomma asiaticum]|uniref:Uncharacterized protein n=1 Tax=Hyalomma asiaticum TaxID=266040 RepID=A0ACB7RYX0_HYAAI|nr:hypothetical protein HPB50_014230 [Hyalomma asiaticum]
MVKSVHCQLDDIERLLESRSSELANGIDKGTLQDLIAILQPFFDAISALEEGKRPNLHLVRLHFAKLQKDLDTHLRSPSIAVEKARLQECALHFLKEKVSLNVEHKIAMLLCPDFRHLRMLTTEEQGEVHAQVRELISSRGRRSNSLLLCDTVARRSQLHSHYTCLGDLRHLRWVSVVTDGTDVTELLRPPPLGAFVLHKDSL